MSDKPGIVSGSEEREPEQSSIHVNEYGSTKDPAVVVEEADRTVLLTNEETVVFEKQPQLDLVPANRPRKVYGGMWGKAEIGAVAGASLVVVGAILLYLFAVVPSNHEVEKNRQESDRLQTDLTSAQSKYGNITTTESQVSKLLTSVNDFELNNLPVAAVGKNALYQKINSLISGYGLVNTTGPDYVPLDSVDLNGGVQSEEERGKAKFRSLFPGVYVTMTLDGPYQNLRRFINDVERGNEFIVISSIELEPADSESHQTTASAQDQTINHQMSPNLAPGFGGSANSMTGRALGQPMPGMPQQQQPLTARGKTKGETVSLRLELAAYFRRPGFQPMEALPAASVSKGGSQ